VRKWIAALAAVGMLFSAIPLEAATGPKRNISPVYSKPPKTKVAKLPKQRSKAQKAAQAKASKAAAAEMWRKGPTVKQREAQRKATRASAAKAKAKPNKRRR
jgi:hypothetical protein